jgi:NAD(P)H dehydrogenase (quinone)
LAQTDLPSLAVTGASGRLGGRVARRLARLGTGQRLIVRDPTRAPQLPGAEVVIASYDDFESASRALRGVQTAFMVSAAETPQRVDQHKRFVDAAVEAGVQRLVYLSFYGAAPDCTFTLGRDHWATEQHIMDTGLAWTMIRDNIYLDFLPMMTGEDGVIRGPAGDGRFAGVAQDDIADAVTAVLRSPSDHDGKIYSLTGPESLTMAEAAQIMTENTGRKISYQPETVPEAYVSRQVYGAPQWQLDAWVSTYLAIARGELDGVTDDVAKLSGHAATSLEELLTRNAS